MMQRVVFFLLALCRVSNAFVVIDPMVGRQFQHTKIMTPTVVEASIAEGANGKYWMTRLQSFLWRMFVLFLDNELLIVYG